MMVIEMRCGCQVYDKGFGMGWELVRKCQALKCRDQGHRRAYEKDHCHAIEARLDEIRRSVQGH